MKLKRFLYIDVNKCYIEEKSEGFGKENWINFLSLLEMKWKITWKLIGSCAVLRKCLRVILEAVKKVFFYLFGFFRL